MSLRQETPSPSRPKGADRVLAVLVALGDHPRGIELARLAEIMGEPKSNVHRALAALKRAGLAQQTERGEYRIGFEALRLAFTYYQALDDRALCTPLLEAVANQMNEIAHYAVLDGTEVVYVAKVEPPGRHVQMSSVVGGRNPAYCTGVGKALLAYHLTSTDQVRSYVERCGQLASRTPSTLTTVEGLTKELGATRERGYAVDDQENDLGIVCIAFPIFVGRRDLPRGAISVTALEARTPLSALVNRRSEVQELIASFETTGNVGATSG